MTEEKLRLLIIGAHPDDAEYHAGALAVAYRTRGHVVKMISLTNGAAGHHAIAPDELATIRAAEAKASANVIGATYEVWDYPDGALQTTLDLRHRIIREIRTFRPDLVLTHRVNDYHPDHRATGQAVQDASFLVCVPLVASDTPALRRDPVVAYMSDLFTKPSPLEADVVFDMTPHLNTIVSMLARHASQMFEWLPWLRGQLDDVPKDDRERLPWLQRWYVSEIHARADRYRSALMSVYGALGNTIECAEIYEVSEYASQLTETSRKRLFPLGCVSPTDCGNVTNGEAHHL